MYNYLFVVNMIRIYCWIQEKSIGAMNRQEVEAGREEQKSSGKKRGSVYSRLPDTEETR